MKTKISIILLLFSCLVFSQKDYRVIESSSTTLLLEYTPNYIDTSIVKINRDSFRDVQILFGNVSDENQTGLPSIPERILKVGVPSEFGSSIKIINAAYKEIDGKILPVPEYLKDEELQYVNYKISSEYYNYTDFPELAAFGNYGSIRGNKVQDLRLFPVKFNPSTNKIRLYKSILLQINFAAANNSSFTRTDDNLLREVLVNYDIAKNWSTTTQSKIQKGIENSVLATGQWIRFEAPQEGIYKIDRNTLQSFGIDAATVDPRTIKIYNNGGKVLSESNLAPRPIDLVENAITITGEADGQFNDNDYIIFYGRGSRFRDYDTTASTIKKYKHPYTEKNYFWITHGGANGKRIENKSSLNTTAQFVQNSTKAFMDLEQDRINLGKTGREFYGDDYSQSVTARSYVNKLDGRLSGFPINYVIRFINASEDPITLQVTENSTNLFSKTLSGYGGTSYTVGRSHIETPVFTGTLPDNRSVLNFNFTPTSATSVGYLDYIEIAYEKELRAFSDQILFFSRDTTAIIEYYLNGFTSTNIKVFDVTDHSNVKLITDHVLLSGGDCRFQVSESSGKVSKYYSVGNDQYFIPVNAQSVGNSNLRGIQEGAKFIIITHNEFTEAANRLKTYRENEASLSLSTVVVDVDQIYNEFSCGVQDVSALRDFVRYAYENWQIKPEFLLLFGKGTYDYNNIEGVGDNFIPTWQSVESLFLLNSYTSDDFFARIVGDDLFPDIAFGRITSRNKNSAISYIEKVIRYETMSERGAWSNLITLIADDGIASNGYYEGPEHTRPSEHLANVIIPESYDFKKIYTADYPAIITGSGRRKPSANLDIIKTMNEGTLLINYIGHGNPDLWAHEHIFERNVAIPQLTNDKYFFLCAATCDFGYYDIPNFQSGAEELILQPNTGGIATFNSARLVYSAQNHVINNAFIRNLLDAPKDSLNFAKPISISSFKTKINHNSVNDQKFHLIGDPTLRLLIPQNEGTVDSVNHQLVATEDIQVRALSKTTIYGRIILPNGQHWNTYNGEGILTVFDSERIKYLEEIGDYPMVIQGGVIFRGRVSVTNGEFRAEFVVPKDISYENKNGKIQFYFFDTSSDGIAFTNKIIVGGTDTTAVNDGEGPEIEIFFDDETYRNAYLVGPEPELIVKLSDETGLNTTGTGVGHALEGILNENENTPIDFTNYFKGELDTGGKEGKVNYKFNPLETGDYSLLVKAWDVFNNFSNETTFFTVVNDDELVVRDVYNYPNPFAGNTTFTFQHNLNLTIDVTIKVYTIAGRMIKEIEERNINNKFVKINWDGRDGDGDILANGSYFYKLIVRTMDGSFSQSVIGKMAAIK